MAIAIDRPTLITPGRKPADPGFESWWVRPGGATVVPVRPGDRLTVRDPDGGQPAEVTVLDAEGSEDAAALGARRGARHRARGGAERRRRRRRPRRAPPPGPQAARRARDPPVRHGLAAGRVGVVHGRARGDGRR